MRRLVVLTVVALITLTIQAQAQETRLKHGEIWLKLPEEARLTFLIGYREGLGDGASICGSICEKEKKERIVAKFQPTSSHDDLEPVMTSLYQDPANHRIPWKDMIQAADSKLTGGDFEKLLRGHRYLYNK